MIDTVLLDLDDTILDFHKSEAFALKKTLEELGMEAVGAWKDYKRAGFDRQIRDSF